MFWWTEKGAEAQNQAVQALLQKWRRGSSGEMPGRRGKVSTPWWAELRSQLRYSAQSQPHSQSTFYTRFNRTDPIEDWTLTKISYAPALISVEVCHFHPFHAIPKESSWTGRAQGSPTERVRRSAGPCGGTAFPAVFEHQLRHGSWCSGHGSGRPASLFPKSPMTCMNGFRLVALSSILCKCMERVVSEHKNTSSLPRRTTSQHNTTLALWIKDFLKDRPQHVRVNSFKSSNIVLHCFKKWGPTVSCHSSSSPYTQKKISRNSNGLSL